MEFRDQKHEKLYDEICSRMKNLDDYHKSLAYLLALDAVCREHISDIFDLNEDGIRPACITASWQTGTSQKTCRLAFNLWNGRTSDGENDSASPYYAVDEIFDCEYAPYYWQAVKLRYPQYTE